MNADDPRTTSFVEHYSDIVASLDAEPFTTRYLERYAARLGGHRPW